MRKDTLTWGIIWRMTAWGFAGGAGLGLFYAMLIFTLAGGIYLASAAGMAGFVIGGLIGGSLGLFNGFVLAGITHWALHRWLSQARYRIILCGVSALLTWTGALLGFPAFTTSWGLTNPWILYTFIPSLIAVAVAVIASARVAAWVESATTVVPKAE